MLRVFFGHHKCASQWMSDIFRDMCEQTVLCYSKCTDACNIGRKLQQLPQGEPCMLFYTNADYSSVSRFPDFLGFHLIRDPRDVCISAYYSHLYSHPTTGWPELTKHRNILETVSFEDGLLQDMEFCKKYLTNIGAWNYADSRVLELRFEEITASPVEFCRKIVAHLDLAHIFSPKIITAAVDKNSYQRKSDGRQPGIVNVHSHYRSGLSDQWQSLFSPKHVEFFNKHYGWILETTDYAQ